MQGYYLQTSPLCYIKYHKVNILHFKKLLILTNNVMLPISRCDTTRMWSSLGPSQIMYVTLDTVQLRLEDTVGYCLWVGYSM